MSAALLSMLAISVFALVHLTGARMAFLRTIPRSIWLSTAGGISVAYVFVHLLPELAERQIVFTETVQNGPDPLRAIEQHVYVIALAGLAAFYGMERWVRQSARREAEAGRGNQPPVIAFWLHLSAFGAYNLLIGYLLVHREEPDLRGLLIYAVAMSVHLLVVDQGLREGHGAIYDTHGRWLLAAAPAVGFLIGLIVSAPPLIIGALFAFLAGGVVLNVLKEELPEQRESRFPAFASGAALYAAVLLATQ